MYKKMFFFHLFSVPNIFILYYFYIIFILLFIFILYIFIYFAELRTDIFLLQKLLAAVGTLLACVLNLKVIQQVSIIYFYI